MTQIQILRDGALVWVDQWQEADSLAAPEPLHLQTIASAKLFVADGELSGIDRAVGLEMAFPLDEQTYWLFFSSPQPDTDYIVMPPDGVTKYPEYVEVVKPDAHSISIVVMKVQ